MNRIAMVGLLTVLAIGLAVGAALARGDAAKGKASFEQLCSSCHGASGKGDGPAAAALNPKPKDLVDGGYVKGLKDDYLKKLIKEGGQAVGKSPMMPAMGATLKDPDIENMIAYLRSIAK